MQDSSHSVEGSSMAGKSTPSDSNMDSAAEDLRQTETDTAEVNKAGDGGDDVYGDEEDGGDKDDTEDTVGASVAAVTPDAGHQGEPATEGGKHADTALQNNVGAETVCEDEETLSMSAGPEAGAGGDTVIGPDGKALKTNEQKTSAGGDDGESTAEGLLDHQPSMTVKSTPSDSNVDSAAEDLRQTETDTAEVDKAGDGGDEEDGGDEGDTAGAGGAAATEGGKHADTAVQNDADAEIQSEDASDKTKPKTETPPAEAGPTAGCDAGDTGSRRKQAQELEGRTRTTEVEKADRRAPPETKSTLHLPVWLAIGAAFILVSAVFVVPWLWPAPEPKKPDLNRVEVFLEEMAKVERSFQNQRSELWRRSRIHLKRHLKSANPSEPVSLILVGGRKAERTLKCLATRLAKAFSSPLNGSVLQVDGSSLANMDHDQVKLDLDTQLKEAFEGDKPAAVIHRLEELPPSSTLIFYRYCDHENAAYKDPLLAFTVLLPQDAVDPEFSISQVEEMAHNHLHDKYLTSDQPDTFDRMDVDKLSGLWSRISHLILPVNMEEHIEKGGCDRK